MFRWYSFLAHMFRSSPVVHSFKSVLKRHKHHPEGLPFYNDMTKQWLARAGERWWTFDAAGEQLPRVAKLVAYYATGQHRPDFTPGMIAGDHVIVLNCKDVVMVGDDWLRIPIAWNTNWPGGKYRIRVSEMYDRDPCMLMMYYCKNEINHHFRSRLKMRQAPLEKIWVYEDTTHPHADKCPRPLHWRDPDISRETWRHPMFQRRWTPNQFLN